MAYKTGFNKYLTFAAMHLVPFSCQHLPQISEEILIFFVSHCASRLHLTYHTIKNYLCGIKYHYISNTGMNPLQKNDGSQLFKLFLIMKGIRRQSSKSSRTRLPITSSILYQICHLLNSSIYGAYNDKLLKAASCLAFYGFLRCGEFTTRTSHVDPSTTICLKDISFGKIGITFTYMSVLIKSSKTDPFRKGCRIKLHAIPSLSCPVTAMLDFWDMRSRFTRHPNSPLFLLADGGVLSRLIFIERIRSILKELGHNPNVYAGHSFRIGAATSSASVNTPDHLIKTLGRWSSDSYQLYIRTPDSLIKNAQVNMAFSDL